MLAYNLLIFGTIALGVLLCEYKPSKAKTILYISLMALVLSVLAAVRAKTVGIDYYQYETYFNTVRGGDLGFLLSGGNMYRAEFGYSLLNFIISRFTGNVYIFMAIVGILIAVGTAVVLYRDCAIPWVGMFLFIAYNFWGTSLAFLRQSLALTIFLFAFRYLMQKRFVPYLLITLLAVTFHKSMLVMIPAYFLAQIVLNWKSIVAYCAATVLVMVFSWPMFNFVTQFIYTHYATEDGLQFMAGRDWNTAFIPVVTMLFVLGLAGLVQRKNPRTLPLLNFSLYAGLLFIMTCQHFLFQRLANIFFAATLFIVPEILTALRNTEAAGEGLPASSAELKKVRDAGERKRLMQERRKIQAKANWHKYYYYYTLGAVLFFGVLYFVWFLYADRINLIPYVTIMQNPNYTLNLPA